MKKRRASLILLAVSLICLHFPASSMDYYTFEIEGKKCGYFEIEDKDGVIYSNALFKMGGSLFENPFWIRYKGGKVLEYKSGNDEKWTSMEDQAENVFPSSAFELLIRGLKNDGDSVEFTMLIEGTGDLSKGATLKRQGNRVEEFFNGQLARYAILDEVGKIQEYGWGGTAKSVRVANREEAVSGTDYP